MIISHRFRFIFIKTTKTAGTSLEVQLSPICPPEDVFTPVIPPEDGHQARNYIAPDGTEYYNHMDARLVRRLLGEERFKDYFKFCVERDPVDKCVSYYMMKKHSSTHTNWRWRLMNWHAFVLSGRFPFDHDKYTDHDGSLMVDRILRYENLNEELSDVFKTLGVPFTGLTTRAKGNHRGPTKPSVTPLHRARIMHAYAQSNAYTGYR